MNTLAKIITGTLVAGSLLLGVPSCKKKSKEEDPKYIQRVAVLEQMVTICEQAKPEFDEAGKKEAVVNCLTDVQNVLELFVPNYTVFEKEYSSFVEISGRYGQVSSADAVNTRNPDLNIMHRSKKFMDTVSEYITQFSCHEKPFEQIQSIRKIILPQTEEPRAAQSMCIDASKKCYDFFESIEQIAKDDARYIGKIIDYAEKNKDKESELICKLAKIYKEKNESVKTKAEYYKNTFKQHSEILKKYFPQEQSF